MSLQQPIARRAFLLHAAGAAAMLAGCRSNSSRNGGAGIPGALQASVIPPEGQPLTAGPFNWPMIQLGADNPVRLAWKSSGKAPSSAMLRLTLGQEVRPGATIVLMSVRNQAILGSFDIRYGYAMQMFQTRLEQAALKEAFSDGLLLVPRGGVDQPVSIFAGTATSPDQQTAVPHLLMDASGDRREALLNRLRSANSFHHSGWMQGCVLDALRDLRATSPDGQYVRALNDHMNWFLAGGAAERTNAAGPAVRTIEATLPAAVIARHLPNDPWISQTLAFWTTRTDREGCVLDGTMTSAEGSYTVAYPMAVLGQVRNDPKLYDAAIAQLIRRKQRLVRGDDIFLRLYGAENRLSMKNWSRGIAWYFLGLVRTLIELPLSRRPVELIDECKRVADFVLTKRTAAGLWHCYAGEPDTGLETSGSAGIAAALALASKHELLNPEYGIAADTTLQALWPYVTPDGFLTGVAQSNAGGEQLQREGYRVIAQFGAGLAGQLIAARTPQ